MRTLGTVVSGTAAAALGITLAATGFDWRAPAGTAPAGPDEGTTPVFASRADDADETARAVIRLAREVEDLRGQLQRLAAAESDRDRHAELGELRADVTDLQIQVAGGGESPREELDIATPMSSARVDEERLATVDAAFQHEAIDPGWSLDASQTISNALEMAAATQTELRQVDCRTTLCFVEVEHVDAQAADDFALQFPMAVADALPQATYEYEETGDGGVTVRIYLARNGHGLPQLVE